MDRLFLEIFRSPWFMLSEQAQASMHLIKHRIDGKPVAADVAATNEENCKAFFVEETGNRYQVDLNRSYEGNSQRKFVLPIHGPITKYGYYGYSGSKERANLLRMADEDASISEIVLLVDSGGGSGHGTHDLALAIKNCSTPVIAVVEDMAASAAYWIAAAADEIYCTNKFGEVGSIGAYLTLCDDTKFWEDMGFNIKDVYADQSKDKNRYHTEFKNEGTTTAAQAEINKFAQFFIDTVKEFRPQVDEKCFTGAMFPAFEAESLGLIDGIKSLEEVLSFQSAKSQIK